MDKYFMYVRKSTEPNDRQKLSLSAQIRENKLRYPDLQYVEILQERHSAFKPEERPVFNEMIRRLEAGEADGVVCWHPDRLSRNEIDGARITYQVRRGKDLKFANYTFDPTPEGIMMLQMALSQSQYSSAKLSGDVRRGNREKLEQGGITWVPGPGFRNNRETKEIEHDPERIQLVKQMFDLALYSRIAPNRIRTIANEEWGYRTLRMGNKRGGRKLAACSIYQMFRSPLYAGFYISKSGRRFACRHTPIISEVEYWQLQDILGQRGAPKPRTANVPYIAGLMRCGECGCSITVDRKSKTLKNGRRLNWEYYRCTKKRGPCSQPYLELRELESQIADALAKIILPEEFYEWAERDMRAMESDAKLDATEPSFAARRTKTDIDRELANLVVMRRRDFIDDTSFVQQRGQLESERAMLVDSVKSPATWLEPLKQLREFSSRCQFWFKNGTPEMKRSILIAIAGSNLTLHNKKLHIQPVGPFEWNSQEVGCAVWQGIAKDSRTYLLQNPHLNLPKLPALPTSAGGQSMKP